MIGRNTKAILSLFDRLDYIYRLLERHIKHLEKHDEQLAKLRVDVDVLRDARWNAALAAADAAERRPATPRTISTVVDVRPRSRSVMENVAAAQDDARRRIVEQGMAQGFTGAVKLRLQVVATIEEGS